MFNQNSHWKPHTLGNSLIRLKNAEIDLWKIDLDVPSKSGLSKISDGDLVRAKSLRLEQDRRRFLNGRQIFHQILDLYAEHSLGFHLYYDEFNRPLVSNNELSVSFSRSGGMAIAAIARGGSLGVDVERLKPLPDLNVAANSVMASEEYRSLNRSSGINKLAKFYIAWTAKEAFLKATGQGLIDDLTSISIDLSSVHDYENLQNSYELRLTTLPTEHSTDDWQLQHLLWREEMCVAVAYDQQFTNVRLFEPLAD
ncbi:MAG: 4'-phosphopantetheinyl transferase superfamily protein [Pseudomonadota bacterium]